MNSDKTDYRIANIGSSALGDGKFIVRFIGDKKPEGEVLEDTRANSEDVYLRTFED